VLKPYYDDGRGLVLYLGDCREVLPALAAGSVDLILTDPPYNVSSRNSRKNTTIGRVKRNRRAIGATSVEDGAAYREIRRDFGAWDHDWDPEPFVIACPRLLRPGGSLISFVTEWTLPSFLATCEAERLDHRSLLYWHKANPAPNFRGLYQRAIEFMVWQTKGGGWTFNANGATHNVYAEPIVDSAARSHPTQKPERLIRRLMLVHSNPGDLLVDAFAGSGTTLRAAKDLGRRCIGIEIEERYCEIVARRLEQEVLPFDFTA
jgi:DNA modification methylase